MIRNRCGDDRGDIGGSNGQRKDVADAEAALVCGGDAHREGGDISGAGSAGEAAGGGVEGQPTGQRCPGSGAVIAAGAVRKAVARVDVEEGNAGNDVEEGIRFLRLLISEADDNGRCGVVFECPEDHGVGGGAADRIEVEEVKAAFVGGRPVFREGAIGDPEVVAADLRAVSATDGGDGAIAG